LLRKKKSFIRLAPNLRRFFSCFSYKRKIQELLDEDDERGGAKMARYDSDGSDGIHEMASWKDAPFLIPSRFVFIWVIEVFIKLYENVPLKAENDFVTDLENQFNENCISFLQKYFTKINLAMPVCQGYCFILRYCKCVISESYRQVKPVTFN